MAVYNIHDVFELTIRRTEWIWAPWSQKRRVTKSLPVFVAPQATCMAGRHMDTHLKGEGIHLVWEGSATWQLPLRSHVALAHACLPYHMSPV